MGIALPQSDKEDFLGGELGIPDIVGGDGYKSREIAVVVQQHMEPEATYGAAEESPREGDRRRLTTGGIQAVEHVFEPEFVLRSQGLAAPVKSDQTVPQKRGGSLVVGIVKSGAGLWPCPQMMLVHEPGLQAGHASSRLARAVN
jgi:hypothetical protein